MRGQRNPRIPFEPAYPYDLSQETCDLIQEAVQAYRRDRPGEDSVTVSDELRYAAFIIAAGMEQDEREAEERRQL